MAPPAWHRERPHSFGEALKAAREILSASQELVAKGSIEAESEQLVIAAYRAASRATGGRPLTRLELFSRIRDRYPAEAGEKLLTLAGTRAEGKPLQHLTGTQVFLDHEYEVGPDVLVPRPETEFLVSFALQELREQEKATKHATTLGLEIGVGSGAISIELLSQLPGLTMLASELTREAIERAAVNARRILASDERLKIVQAQELLHVWEPLVPALGDRRADFVITNPPYLTVDDPIEEEVRLYEPASALFAPPSDPLHFYRQVALNARHYLQSHGLAFAEMAPERAKDVLSLFTDNGWDARLVRDLTGRDRVLVASLSRKG